MLVSTGILSLSIYLKDNTSKSISINSIKDNRAMAFYIENNGEYEHANTFPTSGYKLNEEKSVCSNGAKPSVSISNSINIANLNGSTKCYLYFDKLNGLILADEIKKQSKGEYTEFTGITTEADTGVYSASDDYGTSYYFRGVENKLNNWVEFAGFYWRIIRVNGNGSIRMIYQGEANGAVTDSNKTGITTEIGTSMYNHTDNDNAYVGYMMGIPLVGIYNPTAINANTTSSHSSDYDNAHTNTYESDAKKQLDSWYSTNIENNENYSKHVYVNTGFCNDRQIDKTVHPSHTGDGYSTQNSGYAPWGRVYTFTGWKTTQTAILQCTNKSRDLFTTNTNDAENTGNKKLQYPIGLITSDEVVFAGGFGDNLGYNQTYYLFTNQDYWTMSPSDYNNASFMFFVYQHGDLYYGPVGATYGLSQ